MSSKANFPGFSCPLPAKGIAALLVGTVLVGCAAPGSRPGVSRLEPTYLNLTEERAFASALRQRYLELATNAFDRRDPERSDFYSLRSIMAAEGKLAQPGQPSGSAASNEEARQAGNRLVGLLSSGARSGSPELAARAQAAYDCWLVEMGPNGDPTIAAACRTNALMALDDLQRASTGAARVTTASVGHGGSYHQAATASPASTYTIEPGSGTRTINAPGGYTIEVVTETVAAPMARMAAPAPASYTTVETGYATTSSRFEAAAPIMAEPIAMAPMASAELSQSYTTIDVSDLDLGSAEFAPLPPMIDDGMAGIEMAMMEPMPSALPPMMIESPIEMSGDTSFDIAPLDTVPIYGGADSAPMPRVEMAALPMIEESDSMAVAPATGPVSALIQASSATNDQKQAVFFGFDSAELTLEGEDVLAEVIAEINASQATQVMLMGFTDSVGHARYNQLLAMRRAQAVRKYLDEKLENDVSFTILPVGEVEAVRNGGDGVQEALNRKVEIRLQ